MLAFGIVLLDHVYHTSSYEKHSLHKNREAVITKLSNLDHTLLLGSEQLTDGPAADRLHGLLKSLPVQSVFNSTVDYCLAIHFNTRLP